MKNVVWIASSLRDLQTFPESVQKVMGFAIFQAQRGGHLRSKRGIKTPQHEIDIVESRLKIAAKLHARQSKDA